MGGGILLLLIAAEAALRLVWGFGKMPLYAASDKWEYMVLPDQSGRRLGNNYYYNHYSQRSAEVDSTKKHVLGLGDSVLYGGVQTDQDSLATSLFTAETGIQMLNISAGSWGPDNCAAYLKQYGLFDAKAVFLYVNGHDAHDIMDFQPVVGNHPSYPDKQYFCAIAEVLCRYIYPNYIAKYFKKSKPALDPDQQVVAGIRKNGVGFNPGFAQIKEMCDSANIPLIVCLHPDQFELKEKKYHDQGQEIIRWCAENNVRLVKELDYSFTEADYRDIIHINAHGQRKLANIMKSVLLPLGI